MLIAGGGSTIIAEDRSAAWNSRVSGERGSWWRREDARGPEGGGFVFVVVVGWRGVVMDLMVGLIGVVAVVVVVVVVDDRRGVVGRDLSLLVRWV